MNTLKILRERIGLSQTELATAINVSQQSVAKWESGVCSPRTDKLPEIAKALNCGIPDLFNEQESEVR